MTDEHNARWEHITNALWTAVRASLREDLGSTIDAIFVAQLILDAMAREAELNPSTPPPGQRP